MASILTVTEWQNLLNALRTIVDRYELENVVEAIKYLKEVSNAS